MKQVELPVHMYVYMDPDPTFMNKFRKIFKNVNIEKYKTKDGEYTLKSIQFT